MRHLRLDGKVKKALCGLRFTRGSSPPLLDRSWTYLSQPADSCLECLRQAREIVRRGIAKGRSERPWKPRFLDAPEVDLEDIPPILFPGWNARG